MKPQSQQSLEDQLNELETLAAKNGLYDAQDWLRQIRQSRAKERHYQDCPVSPDR